LNNLAQKYTEKGKIGEKKTLFMLVKKVMNVLLGINTIDLVKQIINSMNALKSTEIFFYSATASHENHVKIAFD
jgi:phage-related holin